jgi:quercetin dioxygenase-like cupin family protein
MTAEFTRLIERRNVELSSPEDGLSRQVLAYSEKLMLVRHLMEAGWIGARHSHPHEQLVYVVRGLIELSTPAGIFQAGEGDSFIVPGGTEHQARALEASEVLDVFTPSREDYAKSGDTQ